MRKNEIQVGGLYLAKVSGNIVTVRVDAIRDGLDGTIYDVTNLKTGRKCTFRSAAKFRCEAKPEATAKKPIKYERCAESCGRVLIGANKPWVCMECGKAKQAFADRVQENMETSEPPAPEASEEADPTPARVADNQHNQIGTADATVEMAAVGMGTEDKQRSDPTRVGVVTAAAKVGDTTSAPTTAPTATTMAAPKALASRIAATRLGRQPGTPVAGMLPTEEQESILQLASEVERANECGRVIVVCAGAGTGKTAQLKMLEQTLQGNGQYTAFNRPLVDEARVKFVKASVHSTHQLAFRAEGKPFQHRLKSERVRSSVIARQLGIENMTIVLKGEGPPDAETGKPTDKIKTLTAEFLAGQVLVAIRKFCQSADRDIETKHFRFIDGIDGSVDVIDEGGETVSKRCTVNQNRVREYLLPFTQKAWADLTDVNGTLPFSHDIYVKLWQLGTGAQRPIIAADYIMLDEAQDTAPVFLDILQQQTHALLILVGDENQQIYEWRGAVNAMSSFKGAPRRLLSQSWRFGQTIADVANTVLAELDEPTDLVMKGNPSMKSRVAKVEKPRCFLYRTNAGCIGRLMAAIEDGQSPHLIGGGNDVVSFCEAAIDLQAKPPRATRHPELCCFESWAEVEEYVKTDEGEDLKLMVKLIKEFGAVKIKAALKDMPKEEDADLVICTAHKSKGREWETVRLGQDFPTANKMADSDRRLLYVALTRAQHTLDISECPPFCGQQARANEGSGGQRGEGGWITGLEINYTVPMPTEAEQAEWLTTKDAPKPKASTTDHYPNVGINDSGKMVSEQPKAKPEPLKQDGSNGEKTTTKQGNGQRKEWTAPKVFKFQKFQDEWAVRGPHGYKAGDKVKVSLNNGGTKEVILTKVMRAFPEATVYGIE